MIENDLTASALIADDETLLSQALAAELRKLWPALQIVATAGDGASALNHLLNSPPDIAFLDIRMPGLTGIEVARELAARWPQSPGAGSGAALPMLVFVTAYGEFALDAFDNAAVDYLLKPVTPARLSVCIERLQGRLAARPTQQADGAGQAGDAIGELREQLAQLLGDAGKKTFLQTIRAAVGDTVRMIPVGDVLLLEAADKYVVVHTAQGQALIRESLRELLGQLDPDVFQQVHRSTIVNMSAVTESARNQHGKLVLRIKGLDEQPVVSRLYTHLFKPM